MCLCDCVCELSVSVCVCVYTAPGMMSAFVLASTGLLSFSQLREGGGKPVASQLSDTKLFNTTVTFSG